MGEINFITGNEINRLGIEKQMGREKNIIGGYEKDITEKKRELDTFDEYRNFKISKYNQANTKESNSEITEKYNETAIMLNKISNKAKEYKSRGIIDKSNEIIYLIKLLIKPFDTAKDKILNNESDKSIFVNKLHSIVSELYREVFGIAHTINKDALISIGIDTAVEYNFGRYEKPHRIMKNIEPVLKTEKYFNPNDIKSMPNKRKYTLNSVEGIDEYSEVGIMRLNGRNVVEMTRTEEYFNKGRKIRSKFSNGQHSGNKLLGNNFVDIGIEGLKLNTGGTIISSSCPECNETISVVGNIEATDKTTELLTQILRQLTELDRKQQMRADYSTVMHTKFDAKQQQILKSLNELIEKVKQHINAVHQREMNYQDVVSVSNSIFTKPFANTGLGAIGNSIYTLAIASGILVLVGFASSVIYEVYSTWRR